MKQRLLLCLFLVSYSISSIAQVGQNLASSASGTSSSSAQAPGWNIYSPDLFNGTVNVNIPIYNYSINGLDLNILLSYNTGGVKVDQAASNVGLGWTLSYGGIITRQVHGVEDEIVNPELDTIKPGDVDTFYDSKSVQQAVSGIWVDNAVGAGEATAELEPDEFTAIIGNKTVYFTIGRFTTTAYGGMYYGAYPDVRVSDKNVQIELLTKYGIYDYESVSQEFDYVNTHGEMSAFLDDPGNGNLLGFKITDQSGNQYFFLRGDYQIRHYTYTTTHPVTITAGDSYFHVPTSWLLSKVISYTGQATTYTYVDDTIAYPADRNQQVTESGAYFLYPSNHPGYVETQNTLLIDTQVIHRVSQINYPNGDIVTFNTDGNNRLDVSSVLTSHSRAITGINISKGYDATIKNSFTYNLKYGYFNSVSGGATTYPTNSTTNPTYNLRLKLLGIDKVGTDGTTTEHYYNFGYIGDNAGEIYLPARLSGLADCYGYYNNNSIGAATVIDSTTYPQPTRCATLQDSLSGVNIPYHSYSYVDNYSDHIYVAYGRDLTPNWAYAQANVLNSVSNGTGGNVKFYYQNHNLSNPPDFNSTPVNTGYLNMSDMDYYKTGYSSDPALEYINANDGICIDSIITTDAYSPDNRTKNIYTFNSGLRFSVGGYFWYPTLTTGSINYDHLGLASLAPVASLYQNNFVTPIQYVNGCNHGYSNAVIQCYGANNALLKTEKIGFTNLLVQPGEQVYYNGDTTTIVTNATNSSRIQMHYGLLAHTAMPLKFDKYYLGMIKADTSYDYNGNMVSRTSNTYAEDSTTIYAAINSQALFNFTYPGATTPVSSEISYLLTNMCSPNLWTSTTTSFSGTTSITIPTKYYYDNFDDLIQTKCNDSKGNTIIKGKNFASGTATVTNSMYHFNNTTGAYTFSHIVNYISGQYALFNPLGTSAWYTTSYSAVNCFWNNYFAFVDYGITITGIMRFPQVYSMYANDKIPLTGYFPTGTSSNPPTILSKDFTQYDYVNNNVLETGYNASPIITGATDQKYNSFIWDSRIGQKVAEVNNARYNDMAYTSFEGSFAPIGTLDYNKGNWDFNSTYISSGSALTGHYYYNLYGGAVTSIVSTTAGEKYIVSFWYNSYPPTIKYVSSGASISYTNQITVGGWTLATATFTAATASPIQLTATAPTGIDELRLLPANATMDTYTYEPLLGVGSHCDERNNITYNVYDAMGRLYLTKDINGNIITMTKTVVQGNDN